MIAITEHDKNGFRLRCVQDFAKVVKAYVLVVAFAFLSFAPYAIVRNTEAGSDFVGKCHSSFAPSIFAPQFWQ